MAFHIAGGLSAGAVHVWQTNASKSFEKLSDITPQNGSFIDYSRARLDLFAHHHNRPGERSCHTASSIPFPFPYTEDFESTAIGKSPQILCGPGWRIRSRTLYGPAGTVPAAGRYPTSDSWRRHQPGSVYFSWQRGLV